MKRTQCFAVAIWLIQAFILRPSAGAQSPSLDSMLIKALSTDELLPVLVDSAIKFSPERKRLAGNEQYAAANLQISKNAIFSAVNLQSSYLYGTNYTAVNSQAGTVPGPNLTTSQSGFYNMGVGIQLPVSFILNRKHMIKAGRSQVIMATAEKENSELSTRLEVIRLYQDFKLAHKILAICTRNKLASQVNNSMAEKDFINGQLTIDRLSLVSESLNRSTLEYETYLNRFETSYMQLETFTGINLSNLIMRVK